MSFLFQYYYLTVSVSKESEHGLTRNSAQISQGCVQELTRLHPHLELSALLQAHMVAGSIQIGCRRNPQLLEAT